MATDVLFPHMSDEVNEGVLVTWFVEPGARVEAGALVASVQVEKVEEEIYAPAAGQVLELLVGQGDVAPQGAVIARIGSGDEEPAVEGLAAAPPGGGTPSKPVPAAMAPVASPAARRVARELGIDLAAVHGTGPGGRIVRDYVPRVAKEGPYSGGALPGTPR